MAGDMFTDGRVGKDLVVRCAKDLEENRMVFIIPPENCWWEPRKYHVGSGVMPEAYNRS